MEAYARSHDTEKFYYGFPVYILAYPDEEVGSESRPGLVVFAGTDGHDRLALHHARGALDQALGRVSSSISSGPRPGLFEYAGTISGGDKLSDTHVASSNYDGIPVLNDSQMSLVCRVLERPQNDGTTHFCCGVTASWLMLTSSTKRGRFPMRGSLYRRIRGRCTPPLYRYFSKTGGVFRYIRALQGTANH